MRPSGVFLRKVDGGYIFTHRLLMEYFATLQPAFAAPVKSGQDGAVATQAGPRHRHFRSERQSAHDILH
jgi:hypothetical protein